MQKFHNCDCVDIIDRNLKILNSYYVFLGPERKLGTLGKLLSEKITINK